MQFIWQGFAQAIQLLLSGDPELFQVIGFTLRFAFASTAIALLAGLPIALALGLGRFRGRRALLSGANAGLGLPPVVIGLLVALLLFRQGPFGELRLIYTFEGIVLGQALLALPIIAALGAVALQRVPEALLEQARALGAGDPARRPGTARGAIGVIAATIAALGSALSEVGLVVLVGGNIKARPRRWRAPCSPRSRRELQPGHRAGDRPARADPAGSRGTHDRPAEGAAVGDTPVLSTRGLRVDRGGKPVVRGVDLDLGRGETVALLGPNGAGKSSLLGALAGLIPASAGTISHQGRVASALQTPALARRTVMANVELALAWWGVARAERNSRAARALRDLGVSALAQRDAASLSGGERRRVHLARVLAVDAEIRLLDEPFAASIPRHAVT